MAVALLVLVGSLSYGTVNYKGETVQVSLLNMSELAESKAPIAEFDLIIERPSEKELLNYSVLNEEGEILSLRDYEALPVEEAENYLYYPVNHEN